MNVIIHVPEELEIYVAKHPNPGVIEIIYMYLVTINTGKRVNVRTLQRVVDKVLNKKVPIKTIRGRVSELFRSPLVLGFMEEIIDEGPTKKESIYIKKSHEQTYATVEQVLASVKEQDAYKREQRKQMKSCKIKNLLDTTKGCSFLAEELQDKIRNRVRLLDRTETPENKVLLTAFSCCSVGDIISVEELAIMLNMPSCDSRVSEFISATGNEYVQFVSKGMLEIKKVVDEKDIDELHRRVRKCKVEKTENNKIARTVQDPENVTESATFGF